MKILKFSAFSNIVKIEESFKEIFEEQNKAREYYEADKEIFKLRIREGRRRLLDNEYTLAIASEFLEELKWLMNDEKYKPIAEELFDPDGFRELVKASVYARAETYQHYPVCRNNKARGFLLIVDK